MAETSIAGAKIGMIHKTATPEGPKLLRQDQLPKPEPPKPVEKSGWKKLIPGFRKEVQTPTPESTQQLSPAEHVLVELGQMGVTQREQALTRQVLDINDQKFGNTDFRLTDLNSVYKGTGAGLIINTEVLNLVEPREYGKPGAGKLPDVLASIVNTYGGEEGDAVAEVGVFKGRVELQTAKGLRIAVDLPKPDDESPENNLHISVVGRADKAASLAHVQKQVDDVRHSLRIADALMSYGEDRVAAVQNVIDLKKSDDSKAEIAELKAKPKIEAKQVVNPVTQQTEYAVKVTYVDHSQKAEQTATIPHTGEKSPIEVSAALERFNTVGVVPQKLVDVYNLTSPAKDGEEKPDNVPPGLKLVRDGAVRFPGMQAAPKTEQRVSYPGKMIILHGPTGILGAVNYDTLMASVRERAQSTGQRMELNSNQLYADMEANMANLGLSSENWKATYYNGLAPNQIQSISSVDVGTDIAKLTGGKGLETYLSPQTN